MGGKLVYDGKEYKWDKDGESVDKLISANAFIGDSLPAVTLSVDTLNSVVRDFDLETYMITRNGYPIFTSDGYPMVGKRSAKGIDKRSEYGQPVEYYHDDKLFGKFYLAEKIKRVGKNTYQISSVSAVGLLLTAYHYGGIYNGEKAGEVIADIVGDTFPYTLDEGLANVNLYGWLPKGTRRDNLRDVLFAIGGQIRKDVTGSLVIGPQIAVEPYDIEVDEFYMGGSVTGSNPATGVDLTEHSFIALDGNEVVTLFNGEAAASEIVTPKGETVRGVMVEFGEPIYDLSIVNGAILEYGANYAVLAQAPAATLTGKRYAHTERIVSRRSENGGVPNIITSRACTLINMMNSELVADKLMAYYGSAKVVEADMVVTGQKPGDAVNFQDPFGDATHGYISAMDVNMSAILKAQTNIVSGYIPSAWGNYYSKVMVVNTSGPVIIPKDSKGKIRVVLIGGGDGGGLGKAGEAGGKATSSSYGSAGKGGDPGIPGNGGKIYVATMEAKPGEEFIASIGVGGKGQTTSMAAEFGGETTFGELSSANGFVSLVGYQDLIDGTMYATPGPEGLAGGSGVGLVGGGESYGENVEYKGVTYVPGANGTTAKLDNYRGYGGGGGGPAAGANGGNGGNGDVDENKGTPFADGGDGGRGATPVKADNGSVPGQGGGAGHGSGGGGGGGGAKGYSDNYQWPGSGGAPGSPGEGGDGADGILLIYY